MKSRFIGVLITLVILVAGYLAWRGGDDSAGNNNGGAAPLRGGQIVRRVDAVRFQWLQT